MTAYGNGINAYRQTQVGTADPKRLVIMCCENVVKQMHLARKAYEAGSFEAKGKALINAQDTVELLLQSLDLEKGGAVAAGLQSLYTYALRRISEGDIQKDLSCFDEVSKLFEELLESWRAVSMDPQKDDRKDTLSSGMPQAEAIDRVRAAGGI